MGDLRERRLACSNATATSSITLRRHRRMTGQACSAPAATQLVTPGPSNGPILVDTFVDDTDAVDTTYFAGGTKITDPVHTMACGGPAANKKTSMDYLYVSVSEIPADTPDNAGHQVLYLRIEEQAAGNGGDNAFGFWLFQNNVACSGSDHSRARTLTAICSWTARSPTAVARLNVEVFGWNGNDTTGTVCGVASNDSRALHLLAWQTDGGRFSTFLADSQSSQSTNSQPKDFAGGQVSTCVPPIINTTAMPGGSTNPLGVANQTGTTSRPSHLSATGPIRPARSPSSFASRPR